MKPTFNIYFNKKKVEKSNNFDFYPTPPKEKQFADSIEIEKCEPYYLFGVYIGETCSKTEKNTTYDNNFRCKDYDSKYYRKWEEDEQCGLLYKMFVDEIKKQNQEENRENE